MQVREASLVGKTITQCNDKWQLTLGISQEDNKEGWGLGQTRSSSVQAHCLLYCNESLLV